MSLHKLHDFDAQGVVTTQRFTNASGGTLNDGDPYLDGQGRFGVVRDDLGDGVANAAVGVFITGTGENGIDVRKATGAVAIGQKLYWDADGDPVGGTADSGALTTTATDNTYVGRAAAAAASGDAEVAVVLINV